MDEGVTYDKKSLQCFKADSKHWDWAKIAKHCVAFANARGGILAFGIEDADDAPPPRQRISSSIPDKLQKGVSQHCLNVAVAPSIQKHSNGGEILYLRVLPSRQTIASTTDARYFLRVADESRPLYPDELARLAAEKDAYTWELQTTLKVTLQQADPAKCRKLLHDLRASPRVSEFVRNKDDSELLQHFSIIHGDYLTNLGVLWIGNQTDRKRLHFPPAIQFIKYDQREEKVSKRVWTDASLNPMELIEAVWTEIPDWKEFTEIPNGLFRDTVPHYDEIVIRELLANALVHRPYTTRGDIFINLYVDHLEIHNPGLLPLGVTPHNILHQRVARNRDLAELFYALGLMEREGSGYDKVYEVLLSQGRRVPEVREDNDRVIVSVERRIVNAEVIDLVAKVDSRYQLTQRERICLGLVAQHASLTALEFSSILAVDPGDRLRTWMGRLLDEQIILKRGRTKGTEYRVNPKVLRDSQFRGPTTLKDIAPHRLQELILADLATHAPDSRSPAQKAEIHVRIGTEIPSAKLRSALNRLLADEKIASTGKRGRGSGYFLRQILPNNP